MSFLALLCLRTLVTIEVAVSKFFPGGFGWQAMGVVRGYTGLPENSFVEYLFTGIGDGLGVVIGHCTWYYIKHQWHRLRGDHVPKGTAPYNATETFQIAVVLGSASFCSGFVWQLVLYYVQSRWTFWPCFFVTGFSCGLCFLIGLRFARFALPQVGLSTLKDLPLVPWWPDIQLAMGVFGSSALFVSTNAKIPGDIFHSFLGVYHDLSFIGMLRAGLSTALGFTAVLLIQNVVLPRGGHWLDAGDKEHDVEAEPLMVHAAHVEHGLAGEPLLSAADPGNLRGGDSP